jgi:hypothetical protein
LRQKDREQAHLMEEKMTLQLKLLAAAGVDNVPERPNYMHLVSEQLDNTKVWKDVNTAVKVHYIIPIMSALTNKIKFKICLSSVLLFVEMNPLCIYLNFTLCP